MTVITSHVSTIKLTGCENEIQIDLFHCSSINELVSQKFSLLLHYTQFPLSTFFSGMRFSQIESFKPRNVGSFDIWRIINLNGNCCELLK